MYFETIYILKEKSRAIENRACTYGDATVTLW